MQLTHERYGDTLVLHLAGRCDSSTRDAFKASLEPYAGSCRADGDRLILDFSEVQYISSVGLRVLMVAARQSRAQGGTIVVAALPRLVREIFEISRFDHEFQCFGSVREALSNVSPAGLAIHDSARDA